MVNPAARVWAIARRVAVVAALCLALVVGAVSPSAAADGFFRCTWNQVDDEGVYLGGNVEGPPFTVTGEPTEALAWCESNLPAGDFYGTDWIDFSADGEPPWVLIWGAQRSGIPLGDRPDPIGSWQGDFAYLNPEDPPPPPDPTELDVLYGISDRLDSVNQALTFLGAVGALLLFVATASMVSGWRRG